jgi:hypothetical protein
MPRNEPAWQFAGRQPRVDKAPKISARLDLPRRPGSTSPDTARLVCGINRSSTLRLQNSSRVRVGIRRRAGRGRACACGRWWEGGHGPRVPGEIRPEVRGSRRQDTARCAQSQGYTAGAVGREAGDGSEPVGRRGPARPGIDGATDSLRAVGQNGPMRPGMDEGRTRSGRFGQRGPTRPGMDGATDSLRAVGRSGPTRPGMNGGKDSLRALGQRGPTRPGRTEARTRSAVGQRGPTGGGSERRVEPLIGLSMAPVSRIVRSRRRRRGWQLRPRPGSGLPVGRARFGMTAHRPL